MRIGLFLLIFSGVFMALRTTAILNSRNALAETIGLFDPFTAQIFLAEMLTVRIETTSFLLRQADAVLIPMGEPGDYPVAGDWDGDGVDTIGVYRPSAGQFFLKNANTADAPIVYEFIFGEAGDIPIAGDWDGDGKDGVGVFRAVGEEGVFYLRNALSDGGADYYIVFGAAGDIPIAGDWNGDGKDGVGVFRPSSATFYLLNNVQESGAFMPDIEFMFGSPGEDVPIAGDWNGDGKDGVGVYRRGRVFLRNTLTTGEGEISLVFGKPSDLPFSGRFWSQN